MAALPYLQLFPADYLADTAHLNAAEHGAYLLLIMNYWQRGKPLCNRGERLAHVVRMTTEEWAASRDTLAEFFEINGDEWRHLRIEEDLQRVNESVDTAKRAGRNSAKKRQDYKDPQPAADAAPLSPSSDDGEQAQLSVSDTAENSTVVQRPFNDRSTTVQRPFNDRSTNKILEDSSKPPPVNPPPPGGGAPVPDSNQDRRRSKSSDPPTERKKTFAQWVSEIKERGERAISDYKPVWDYAERVGLPRDFVEIAWLKFRERFAGGSKKRYVDWRQAFLRYVEGNYFRLWFWADADGVFKLTTAGVQADRETREPVGAA